MPWIPSTAGFQIDQDITDPSTNEIWTVLNVGVVREKATFLHLIQRPSNVQRGAFVNRKTGEHTSTGD